MDYKISILASSIPKPIEHHRNIDVHFEFLTREMMEISMVIRTGDVGVQDFVDIYSSSVTVATSIKDLRTLERAYLLILGKLQHIPMPFHVMNSLSWEIADYFLVEALNWEIDHYLDLEVGSFFESPVNLELWASVVINLEREIVEREYGDEEIEYETQKEGIIDGEFMEFSPQEADIAKGELQEKEKETDDLEFSEFVEVMVDIIDGEFRDDLEFLVSMESSLQEADIVETKADDLQFLGFTEVDIVDGEFKERDEFEFL
ncbi:hypothetical protein AMTR_s00074p00177930 [Amborella trichopoda]|uniref:Uncharacterized protein n=1 Tax=Amborella trichopoda TaxID=13333 RepID=W1NPM6_AMBTC|nr:hypothetical protein AMTR_s00074p00177930 [Amborella trichopoda]